MPPEGYNWLDVCGRAERPRFRQISRRNKPISTGAGHSFLEDGGSHEQI